MKVRLGSISKFDESGRYLLNDTLNQISKVLNNIEFGGVGTNENVSCVLKTATTPSPSATEFSITHDLGRIPVGFIVVNKDKYCDVMTSGTAWTTSLIYLKCNAATAAITVLII